MTDEVVRAALPPRALLAVLNPLMRTLLRTPLGRFVRPFALLDFTGRSSGRRYRIPVGWHDAGGVPVVFSPSAWRINFEAERLVNVHHRGRREQMIGWIVSDPNEVADALNTVIEGGTEPRLIALDMPPEHRVTSADVVAIDRRMIRFRAATADHP